MEKNKRFIAILVLVFSIILSGCVEDPSRTAKSSTSEVNEETEEVITSTEKTTREETETTEETAPAEDTEATETKKKKKKKSTETTAETTATATTETPAETTVEQTTKQETVQTTVPVFETEPISVAENIVPVQTEATSADTGGGGGGSSQGSNYWGDYPYVANANPSSLKFHRAGCDSIGKMKDSHKVGYYSAQAAIDDGYTPCKRCHPENDI